MEFTSQNNLQDINDKLAALEKKFTWHNHADGYTQPVFLGQLSQGTSNQLQPIAGGTLGENITNGNALMVSASDGKVYKANATSQANCDRFLGIAIQSQVAGETPLYISFGFKTDYSNLVAGAVYYLTNANGVIGTSPGSYTKKIGIAVSSSTLLIINN